MKPDYEKLKSEARIALLESDLDKMRFQMYHWREKAIKLESELVEVRAKLDRDEQIDAHVKGIINGPIGGNGPYC